MVDGWKIVALIFILLFLAETVLVVYVWRIGGEIVDKESECSINICPDKEADSYWYSNGENICYCLRDNEIVYQEYLVSTGN